MRKAVVWGIAGIGVLCGGLVMAHNYQTSSEISSTSFQSGTPSFYTVPTVMAKWPLPGAKSDILQKGVTHWFAKSHDRTQIDFIDFDFGANPRLRFEIFDQDEDDEKPLDNHVEPSKYLIQNVSVVTRKFNVDGKGTVIAAWNGAFFGRDSKTGNGFGFHISPVVLRGKAHFNVANQRWTFGVKKTTTGPKWKVLFKPSRQVLEKEFDYAAGGVQCLVKDGKPLKTEPFPPLGGSFKEGPVPSSEAEAGHIPKFDHMRTSRASIGWSRDNKHLYLLAVKEPDDEASSGAALAWAVRDRPIPPRMSLEGGWTVPDIQKFWISKGVWAAINSDAGDVMQLVFRHPKGNYTFVPPGKAFDNLRLEADSKWMASMRFVTTNKGFVTTNKGFVTTKGLVPTWGGTIMYFMVREK